MADVLGKKISELEETTDLAGLYTIGSDRNGLSKKVSLQFVREAADYANAQGEYAEQIANNITGFIGLSRYSIFDPYMTYEKGDIVRYDGQVWRFTQHHAPGAWVGTDAVVIWINDTLRVIDFGNRTQADIQRFLEIRDSAFSYRYTGVIELLIDGNTYYGTILHISRNEDKQELVVRFMCENTMYKAINTGLAAIWEIQKITDLAEWEQKLAQLSQEWQGVKDSIQDAVLKVEVAPHIEVVAVSGGAAILQPDKLYNFGEVATLAVGFEAPLEGKAANYAFQFKSPASAPTTITMPDSVVFPVESDSMFNVKAGRTYQVTILNNLASASSWEV
jgi:hypothetical protein